MATTPAPIPTRSYTFTAGTDAVADQVNHELDTVYGVLQGAVGNIHIADQANIAGSKLAAGTVTKTQIAVLDEIMLYQQLDVNLPNNVSTAITYGSGSEQYKVGAIQHDVSSNPSRVTVQTAGKYLLIGSARYANGNTVNRYENAFLVNGTGVALGGQSVPASGTSLLVTATAKVMLAAGDYVELLAFQQTGGTIQAQALSSQTFFSVSLTL